MGSLRGLGVDATSILLSVASQKTGGVQGGGQASVQRLLRVLTTKIAGCKVLTAELVFQW